MNSCIRNILKLCLPYGVLCWYRYHLREKKTVTYTGNYESWEEAARFSRGYEEAHILEKVKSATREVLEGNAVFERDSVLFFDEEPNYPLIAHLLASGRRREELSILDFGGSLGSVYFQNRKMLSSFFRKISWRIVEQKHFVAAGRDLFPAGHDLSFYESWEEALSDWDADVVLFSSTLQYLGAYESILRKIKSCGIRTIIADRCLCFTDPDLPHRYCVQHVPEEIYKASYPVQIFSKNEIAELLSPEYILSDEFSSYPGDVVLQKDPAVCQYRGLVFTLKHS